MPVGTVTFLLTDIEGSSRAWETAPEAMAQAVARHYEILDEAIARQGGVRPVEQGEGDSVLGAFARATAHGAITLALGIREGRRSDAGRARFRSDTPRDPTTAVLADTCAALAPTGSAERSALPIAFGR